MFPLVIPFFLLDVGTSVGASNVGSHLRNKEDEGAGVKGV